MAVDHYENFPVASWLCPPEFRPAVMAIYRFARTADDLADEGAAPESERIAALDAYRECLHAAAAGQPTPRWPEVFAPLADALQRHSLPLPLLSALLDAFRQDCTNPHYADRAALLDYCQRSANPIGRLLLHLAGVSDRASLMQSDAICTSLQLINFWQDPSVDLPRGRCYVPAADAMRHGLALDSLAKDGNTTATRALIAELCGWARDLMWQGAPLVHRVPGRFGWELRAVVQGGLHVLDKIEAGGWNTLTTRPTVGRRDLPRLAWRAWRMNATADALRAAALSSRAS